MIPRIFKTSSSAQLVSYLLKPTKEAQIVDSSVFTPTINTLIASEEVLMDSETKRIVSAELNQAFGRINDLNPRLVANKMAHLIIGFDPLDGELSPEFKGQIAREFMEQLGYSDTYWVAISHGRDDPEHDHIHNHDHMHILAARVATNGKTISDSFDFPRARSVLDDIQEKYKLTPFVPFWEREYMTPEIHMLLQPVPEISLLEQHLATINQQKQQVRV